MDLCCLRWPCLCGASKDAALCLCWFLWLTMVAPCVGGWASTRNTHYCWLDLGVTAAWLYHTGSVWTLWSKTKLTLADQEGEFSLVPKPMKLASFNRISMKMFRKYAVQQLSWSAVHSHCTASPCMPHLYHTVCKGINKAFASLMHKTFSLETCIHVYVCFALGEEGLRWEREGDGAGLFLDVSRKGSTANDLVW